MATATLEERFASLKAQDAAPAASPTPTQAPAAPAPAVRGGNAKPNQFAGSCTNCGSYVEAGAGLLGGTRGAWTVSHIECTTEPTIAPLAPALPDEGVYVLEDGTIVKIKSNKTKTNRYANRWVKIGGERLTETGEHVNGEWEYAPELRSDCTEDLRMTLDQAKEFGVLYGKCVKCGRHLSDAESVERAIGPVCARSFSL